MVREGSRVILSVRSSAVFWNWIHLRGAILKEASEHQEIVVDLSRSKIVDHSVMEKLHELEAEFQAVGKTFEIIGMDDHTPMSAHPFAARKHSETQPPTSANASKT